MVTSLSGHGIAFQVMAREQVKSKSFETIYASKLFLTFLGSGDSVNIFGVDSQVCFVRSLHQRQVLDQPILCLLLFKQGASSIDKKKIFSGKEWHLLFIFKCAFHVYSLKNLHQFFSFWVWLFSIKLALKIVLAKIEKTNKILSKYSFTREKDAKWIWRG